jgi:hypothetical protein
MSASNIKAALIACVALLPRVAEAEISPDDYVYMPAYQDTVVDLNAGTRNVHGDGRESAASLGVGYPVTTRWFTQPYVNFERNGGQGTSFDSFEWQNTFLLTPPGRYDFDIAFFVEVERPRERDEGYEVRFGPLFQLELDRTQLNLNLFLSRSYHADDDGPMRLGYQWQAKYRFTSWLQAGAQGFGDFGRATNFSSRADQSHLLGPMITGRLPPGVQHAVTYEAAYLFDAGDAKHSRTFRLRLEYAF